MAEPKINWNPIKSNKARFIDAVFRQPRFAPAWFVVLFTPLLYIRNLGQWQYQVFIPAIVVSGLGTALLGTFHRLIALAYVKPTEVIIMLDEERKIQENVSLYPNNEMTIPFWGRFFLYITHIAWFGLFISYLIYREIINIGL